MLKANASQLPKVVLASASLILMATVAALTTLWALPHEAAAAPTAAVSARVAEAHSDGTVKSEQKISDTAGGFNGILDNFDQFGVSVAGLGDLDGDGVSDLAVGAFGDGDGGPGRGAVYILFMNADGTVKSDQKISDTAGGFNGVLDNFDQFGISIASMGDLDGDGVSDLAVGAIGDDDGGTLRGAVYILFMNSNGTVKSEQKISDIAGGFNGILEAGDQFGISVASMGDLDGDLVFDLAVGASSDDDGGFGRGAVYILFMNANGTVKSEQKISDTKGGFSGVLDNFDDFGASVAGMGDLDGNLVFDLAVGAKLDDDGGTDRGAVWILFMNANGTVKSEQKISDTGGGFNGILDNGDQFGSVASMGDFDGDLVFDLAVGASGDADGGNLRGAVYILFMNANGTVKSEQKISDTEGGFSGVLDNFDQFGASVAGMGDLDGDLVSELAVGAFGDADGGASRGAVWILFMNPGTASTADLSLAKSDSPDPVAVGSSLAYTLTVTNESPGPGTATGVVVTDTLPTGVTFKSAAPSQGTVDPVTGAEVVWNVGDLVQGQSETLEILVTIDSTTLDGAVLTNTAVVAGGQPDPVLRQ